MLYLSQLLGTPVEDLHGARVGKIIDIAVHLQEETPGATFAHALLVEGQAEAPWRVPIQEVEWHEEKNLRLRIPFEQLPVQGDPRADTQEVCLARDILDKQVIDIVRKKAVRVNDVGLSKDWQVQGIDTSAVGLLRRLTPTWLLGRKARQTSSGLLAWAHVEPIGTLPHLEEDVPSGRDLSRPYTSRPYEVQRAQSGHLAELRPADIAEIVHQLTPGQGARLIEGLDDETAADTMEEIDTERQRHILENIQTDRAADILEAMEPDEAADLLAQLPEERAQELLRLMTTEESEDVQELLEYEEDTAGGLMTTDYLVINQTKSVAEALEAVRLYVEEEDIRTAYVYCVIDDTADEYALCGVVSIWDLLVAPPTQTLQTLMKSDLITVAPDADPHIVAQIIAKYNLLAVPVVNAIGFIEGIVTVDDALDVLLPAQKRRKPPRMY